MAYRSFWKFWQASTPRYDTPPSQTWSPISHIARVFPPRAVERTAARHLRRGHGQPGPPLVCRGRSGPGAPAARIRQGRDVHDAGGRDGRGQSGGLAKRLRGASAYLLGAGMISVQGRNESDQNYRALSDQESTSFSATSALTRRGRLLRECRMSTMMISSGRSRNTRKCSPARMKRRSSASSARVRTH
jgi:hypothetical protein